MIINLVFYKCNLQSIYLHLSPHVFIFSRLVIYIFQPIQVAFCTYKVILNQTTPNANNELGDEPVPEPSSVFQQESV